MRERQGEDDGMAERFEVRRSGASLAGVRWPGGDRTVVLLHEGVADSRGWAELAALLAPEITVVAYDRRGFGQTPVSTEPFSHLDDLLAVLDAAGGGSPVFLVGASAGGGLALDAALAAPSRSAGVVVMGTAVSGSPEPALDPATARFDQLLEKAYESRDVDEINRLETWLWLDGPAQAQGRVGGAARALALDMNAVIIHNDAPEEAGGSGLDTWHRLTEIDVPVTVACGDLDVPYIVDRCRLIAEQLPRGRHRVLAGMAHQPYLESPETVAELIRSAVRLGHLHDDLNQLVLAQQCCNAERGLPFSSCVSAVSACWGRERRPGVEGGHVEQCCLRVCVIESGDFRGCEDVGDLVESVRCAGADYLKYPVGWHVTAGEHESIYCLPPRRLVGGKPGRRRVSTSQLIGEHPGIDNGLRPAVLPGRVHRVGGIPH